MLFRLLQPSKRREPHRDVFGLVQADYLRYITGNVVLLLPPSSFFLMSAISAHSSRSKSAIWTIREWNRFHLPITTTAATTTTGLVFISIISCRISIISISCQFLVTTLFFLHGFQETNGKGIKTALADTHNRV